MPGKVKPMEDRKTFYMSDLRKTGRIAVHFGSFFESVNNAGQWVADLEWRGERRYFNVDGEIDRESFKRLPEDIDIEIESVGRSGLDKVAIWKDCRWIDLHEERTRAVVSKIGDGSGPTTDSIATATRISVNQVLNAYAKIYRQAVPMVGELDPRGEQGLTPAQIAGTVLTAYLGTRIFTPR